MSDSRSTPPDDSILIAQAKRGDTHAFGSLYERYLDSVYRYVQSHVGNARDAEDLTEQVFLRAYQALGSYQARGHPFSAFLYKVARNMLVDHRRGQKEELPIETAEQVLGDAHALDEGLLDQVESAALQKALDELPPDYGEVIRLRMLLGLPTETVASWMGRSEGAVRVLLYRALKMMRRKLARG